MTLPVRAGVHVTRFALRTSVAVSARALALASGALKSVSGRGSGGAAEWPAPRASSTDTSTQTAAPEREREPEAPEPPPTVTPPPTGPTAAEDGPAPAPQPPAHVSEEPALVEEFAEPGAEDGAGASIHVEEPWDGYSKLTAREIVGRLSEADAAELAALQLYESTHKRRETVLSAIERALRIKSASTAPAGDQLRKEQTNGN